MNIDAKHPGEIIRAARESQGLSADYCAGKCGLSGHYYYDVEAYGDEFVSNISLGTARRICNLLGLDILDLTSAFLKAAILERSRPDDASFFSRNALVQKTRLKLGMTPTQLGDVVGFESIMIEMLEKTPDFVETLPINVVVDLATSLRVDPGVLVCNR